MELKIFHVPLFHTHETFDIADTSWQFAGWVSCMKVLVYGLAYLESW